MYRSLSQCKKPVTSGHRYIYIIEIRYSIYTSCRFAFGWQNTHIPLKEKHTYFDISAFRNDISIWFSQIFFEMVLLIIWWSCNKKYTLKLHVIICHYFPTKLCQIKVNGITNFICENQTKISFLKDEISK